ncbi:MAG: LysR family transcriptional regulator [Gammaproteobacteria bacterium]|nr:MAG: LysR family transcriptional regulator [Gammaproteobacteria bacterium]
MTKLKTPYYKQNRLKQLRAFCHAAQCGSITEAAENLFLSQPSVTLQIQALEREMEITVFERRGPKISLTPEGEVLYRLASPLVEAIDGLQDSFHAHMGNLQKGELNIAAGESTILYVLPETTKQFAEEYPGIGLKLHNVTGRDGLSMIRADQVDFAVGSMLEVPDDIRYEPIVTYYPALITAPDHPLAQKEQVTLKDISEYGLILPPRHLSTWRIVELVFQQHDLQFKVALEAGGWEVIKKYVELDLGISIVTDVCLTDTDKVAVKPLGKYFPTRSYGIVSRRGKFLSPAAVRYIDMLREYYADKDPSEVSRCANC